MYIEKYYFHADVEKYSENLRRLLVIVLVPIFTLCTFCSVNIVLNFRSNFAKFLMIVILASVFCGMVFTFLAVYITDKKKRRHARYTFFDIIPYGMVYSEYAGEFTRYGERVILRRLYYIPFEKLESVFRDPKVAPHDICFKGEMREYFLETDRLGYHINEDGKLEFDSFELNTRLFSTVNMVTVKKRLGNTKRLERSVLYYWEQFKSIPEKKPFDISNFVSERRRKKLKTSNAALEKPSFSRNWK